MPFLRLPAAILLSSLLALPAARSEHSAEPARVVATVAWPEPTETSKPWTRWWWHGSAVDKENLTRLLETYHSAGLGGVEITCIYGVRGNEARDLAYRSEPWTEAVRHAIAEADRLGMGVDLPAGSGWRMGGPDLPRRLANTALVLQKRRVTGPADTVIEIEDATPQAVFAFDSNGEPTDLTELLDERTVRWQAPAGEWTVVTAGRRLSGDRVKRAGPGGDGLNINPFWRESVEAFLSDFDSTANRLPGVRAQFHDSFEYEGDWSPVFFEEFANRRGYRLEKELLALSGGGDPTRVARVKTDYRETLSDLVLDCFIQPWIDWSHRHGALARNQSHGSPANWLDLYAACDIPETESFGRLSGSDADSLVLKFASSAANVAGRRLVSCESATWLDEHFQVSLAQVKQILDRQMLAGVNHVFYHGTAYSPADAAWPGWLFYASTQLNPQNALWRDLPALNQYVTRCQSLLQASRPDNDILLYWPLHDAWSDAEGLRKEIRVHNGKDWLFGRPFYTAAEHLHDSGYGFDYTSDKLLLRCKPDGAGRIAAPGGHYAAVLVPAAERMPLATVERLAELASEGCRVLFWRSYPDSLPGLAGLEDEPNWASERQRFAEALKSLRSKASHADRLEDLLGDANVRPESWADGAPLRCLRRATDQGTLYLVVNEGDTTFDNAIRPHATGDDAMLLDPLTGQIGRLPLAGDGRVRLQLEPKQTVFLLITSDKTNASRWSYREPAGEPTPLSGPWRVEFVSGGPETPDAFTSDAPPHLWTGRGADDADRFAGTARYRCRFDAPRGAQSAWLDLGKVHESARVALNGEELGVLLGPTYGVRLDALLPTGNTLDIEVTGLSANRIRDLDRRGVEWRVFKDINFVNIRYGRFDASDWPVRPQGLEGPVTLTPLAESSSP